MSQGGSESRTVGLPNNSTSPGMGGLGIGGGIYGNPFQVNQMSQPNALQGALQPFAMGMGQPMQRGGQFFNQMNQGQQIPLMGRMNQGQPMQPGGQFFNQMQAGLGSLVPGNHAMRASDPARYQPVINAAPI